ncbi:MAG: hypothetical protein JWR08_2389 [Enterovirga sp.]|nr:hypothetical protein [Enterovirga sp.]
MIVGAALDEAVAETPIAADRAAALCRLLLLTIVPAALARRLPHPSVQTP